MDTELKFVPRNRSGTRMLLQAASCLTPSTRSQHPGTVSACVSIPGQPLLLSTCWEGSAIFTDITSNRRAADVPSVPGGVLSASAAGSYVLLGGADRRVLLYDLRNLQQPVSETMSLLTHQTTCVALSATGQAAAVASVGGHIKVLPTNELPQGSNAPLSSVKSLTCHRLDVQSGKCTQRGGLPLPVNTLQWCPQPSREPLMVSGGGDGSLAVWDTSQGRSVLQREALGRAVTAAAWNAAGSHLLYATGEDGAQGSTAGAAQQQQQQQPVTIRLMHVQ